MRFLFDHLRPFIRFVVARAWVIVATALLLSTAGFYFAQKLQIDTDFAHLIPSSYPSVQAIERLRETVGAETMADVVIESPSFEANRAFAEDFIPRALALEDAVTGETFLTRVDYRRDTEFLEQNALYFATDAELDSLENYLREERRRAVLEASPFYFDLDDEEEEDERRDVTRDLEEVRDRVIGKPYPVSEDSTIMVLRFYPAGAQTNIGFIERMYDELQRLVDAMNPAAYHAEMEITLAGRMLRQLVEVQAITSDVFRSFAAGVSAVLLFVVLYFFYKGYTARVGHRYSPRVIFTQIARTPMLALLIGTPLLMSLTWTFGTAYLIFSTLNLMTSTLGLVLFGLGIDYGIHFFARYTEERKHGRTSAEAAETTFASTGQAIAIGALTTAAALYVLVIADFRGFSEFGVIAGTGILFALIAMTVVLPALLILFERHGLLNLQAVAGSVRSLSTRRTRFPGARGILLASLAAVVAALVFLPRVGFEYDFGALEPEYTEYVAKRDLVRTVYPSRGVNPAYVVVDDPSEVPNVVEAVLRTKAERDSLAHAAAAEGTVRDSSTVERVESLQERFPMTPEAQRRKLERIATIRELLEDPFIQAEAGEDVRQLENAARTVEPLAIDEIPESIRNQFTSRTGELGNFVMIYPAVGLADGRNSMAFAEEIGTIVTEDGTVYHAASTSLVAADMLRLMLAEAPYMVMITFLIVILFMWMNFGSIRWALLATLPLIVGVLWMLLLMEIFGLRLNFYNLVVLPAVLGIGNDAGVHLVHRYREEGLGSIMRVIRSTGEHITMGSLTTMMGFSGLLLSFHPGLNSIGELAVAGIGMTLLAALLFLPAILQWREDRVERKAGDESKPKETESREPGVLGSQQKDAADVQKGDVAESQEVNGAEPNPDGGAAEPNADGVAAEPDSGLGDVPSGRSGEG